MREKGKPVSQLTLPMTPMVEAESASTIQERFENFHTVNPWILDAFETLTAQWLAAGHTRLSISTLTEIVRWRYGTTISTDGFKINNSFRSRYVRLMIARNPALADVFVLRELDTP